MLKNLKSRFLRSVFVLVGGTALGHLITALTLPILTRLYSPEDFNVLAVFASAVAIISVAAALRFDIAVSVAESETDAVKLLILALVTALTVAIAVSVIVLTLPESFLQLAGMVPIASYLWLLPVGIFLAAAYSSFQGWFIRSGSFSLIAKSRVTQSASMATGQIGLGVGGFLPFGLLIGHTLNTAIGCLVLGSRFYYSERKQFVVISRSTLIAVFRSYNRFPKYSTLEALCNSAAIQVPVIMIASLAVGPEAGFMILAMSVMQAPMSLIGTAIGQVYLSRAPEEYRNGQLSSFTLATLGGLSKAGVGPLLFAAIVAPDAFAMIFGEQWRRAGEIVTWMTPWFILQFLSSPLSMSVHVTGHQRVGMALQIFGLVLRVLSVWCAYLWFNESIVETYSLSGFLFYLLYLLVILMLIRIPLVSVLNVLIRIVPILLVWVVASISFLWLISLIGSIKAWIVW